MSGKKAITTIIPQLRNYLSNSSSRCNHIGRRYIHSATASPTPPYSLLFRGGSGGGKGITMSPFGARSYCSAGNPSTTKKTSTTMKTLRKRLDYQAKKIAELETRKADHNKYKRRKVEGLELILCMILVGQVLGQALGMALVEAMRLWNWIQEKCKPDATDLDLQEEQLKKI